MEAEQGGLEERYQEVRALAGEAEQLVRKRKPQEARVGYRCAYERIREVKRESAEGIKLEAALLDKLGEPKKALKRLGALYRRLWRRAGDAEAEEAPDNSFAH